MIVKKNRAFYAQAVKGPLNNQLKTILNRIGSQQVLQTT